MNTKWFPTWLSKFRIQALIIAVLSISLYANTITHEYALDDTVVIVQNGYVLMGISGIPDILSKDGYDYYYKRLGASNQLSGGRYRPLSLVTFALEQQIFGAIPAAKVDSVINSGISYGKTLPYEQKFIRQMHIRHLVNVLLFALSMVVLLWFLRTIVFPQYLPAAFFAAVLFAIHPIHTEVVANVKSRDEILSLLSICLTFIYAFRYQARHSLWQLAAALGSFALALLAKEYAVMLVVLLPVSFYIYKHKSVSKSLLSTLPYIAIVTIYLLIRYAILPEQNDLADADIQINPYAFASASEQRATEIATLVRYIKLLVFPHPLSSDYSYAQIPYTNFGDPLVWRSAVVHISLIALAIYFIFKRHFAGFALAFYLGNLLLVGNILFDIGATMGERLIYHSSLGYIIIAGWVFAKTIARMRDNPTAKMAIISCTSVIFLLCCMKTVARNEDWKNDKTLFFQDINASPHSFLVNANVATMLVNGSDFEKDEQIRAANLHRAVALFSKVINMQNTYVLGYMNRGVAYIKLEQPDSVAADIRMVLQLYPIHPQLPEMLYHTGRLFAGQNRFADAAATFEACLKLNPGFEPARMAQKQNDSIMNVMSDAGIDK